MNPSPSAAPTTPDVEQVPPRPRVVMHWAMSLDGATSGFEVDLGMFYSLAARWKEDITLAGSETILATGMADEDPEAPVAPTDAREANPRPLLVVVDGRGRVMCWKALRDCGFWRGVIAVCSSRTPGDYRELLGRRGVECIVVGDDRVDLPAALDVLGTRYGAMLVRTESGGTLNRALMAHGLVDEVSVVLLPVAGVDSPGTGDPRVAGVSVAAPLALALEAVEPLDGGGVWLRYRRRG